MTALAKHEPAGEVAPVSYSDSILAIIAQAARDPNVDIDKMERLLQMQERVQSRDAKAAYAAALALVQPELPVITERGGIKNGKGEVQSTYAKWEDINYAIKPVLATHGFALSFRTGRTPDGAITVTGVLMHREGHQEETTITLPHDSSGSKNAVQAVGSSTSYGKRYTAMALLNITSRGEDDDGVAAGMGATVSEEQLARITALANETNASLDKLCKLLGVDRLMDIPAARFNEVVEKLRARKQRPAPAAAE